MRTHLSSPAGLAPVPLLLFFLTGCGSDAPGPGESSDVEVVRLGAPEVRFGSLDDPGTALVPVDHLTLAEDGTIWFTQAQEGRLRGLTPEGTPTAAVGRRGEGPGEFQAMGPLGWLGDTLWVADRRNGRITFVGPAGELRGSVPLPRLDTDPGESASFTALVPGGALFVVGPGAAALQGGTARNGGADPVVVAPREGGTGRSVGVRTGTRPQALVTEAAGGDLRAVFIFTQPWADGTLVVPGPGGGSIVFVDRPVRPGEPDPTYTVTRVGLAGDTVWRTARSYAPVPVDPVHRDSLLARYAESGARPEALRESLFLPPTHPPAATAFVARDGRVWVGRERPVAAERWQWDVFSAGGRLEMTVDAPVDVELHDADGVRAWGVETDPLDVPRVVAYHLPDG